MLAHRALLPLFIGALVFSACEDKGGASGDDTGSSSDGGDGGDGGGDGGDGGAPDWETGCIAVSGISDGFAYLTDALEQAADGDTITLCEGDIDEAVTIDKAISLTGPGPDLLIWTAPSNEPAITVSGTTGASVSGFTVVSTRAGIEVANAGLVTLSDLDFPAVGSNGVSISQSTDVLVERCTFTSNPLGAVQVSGGSATVRQSTIEDAVGFGVRATAGAEVTVEGSAITGTVQATESDGLDGNALFADDGAHLTSRENVLSNNVWGILATEADLTSDGDTLEAGGSGAYGIWVELGAANISGATLTDFIYTGIVIFSSGDAAVLSDLEITGTPGAVLDESYGVVVQADSASLTGVDVYGYNQRGIWLTPFDNDMEVTLTDVVVDESARIGLHLDGVVADMVNVSVTNHRRLETLAELWADALIVNGGAVEITGGEVTWEGGEVTDAEWSGIVLVQGVLDASGLYLAGNEWAGIFNFQGSLYLSGSTISDSGNLFGDPDIAYIDSGGVYSYQALSTLEGNTFVDNLRSTIYELDKPGGDPKGATWYEITRSSRDVMSYNSSLVQLIDNHFSSGSFGLFSYQDEEVLVSGNSWADYKYAPLYFYSATGTAQVEDNTFDEVGAYAIYCYGSEIDVDGLTVTGAVPYEYEVNYYDDAGKLIESQFTSYYNWQFYAYDCGVELRDALFQGNGYQALSTWYGSVELYDVSVVEGATEGADYYGGIYSYSPEQLFASNIEVRDQLHGYGMYLVGYTEGAPLAIEGLNVSGNPDEGLYGYSSASYGNTLALSDVTADDNGGRGIYLSNFAEASFEGVSASGNGEYGVYLNAVEDVDISGAAIDSNGMDGVWVYAGDFLMRDSSASSNAGSGLYLSQSDVTLLDNVIESNGAYGLWCDGSNDWSICATNSLEGNTSGEHYGCVDCYLEGDTGAGGDTGAP